MRRQIRASLARKSFVLLAVVTAVALCGLVCLWSVVFEDGGAAHATRQGAQHKVETLKMGPALRDAGQETVNEDSTQDEEPGESDNEFRPEALNELDIEKARLLAEMKQLHGEAEEAACLRWEEFMKLREKRLGLEPTEYGISILALAERANIDELLSQIVAERAEGDEAARASWALVLFLEKHPERIKDIAQVVLTAQLDKNVVVRLIYILGHICLPEATDALLSLSDAMPEEFLPFIVTAIGASCGVGWNEPWKERLARQRPPSALGRPYDFFVPVLNTKEVPPKHVLNAYMRLTQRKGISSQLREALIAVLSSAMSPLTASYIEEGRTIPDEMREAADLEYARVFTNWLLTLLEQTTTASEQSSILVALSTLPFREVEDTLLSHLRHNPAESIRMQCIDFFRNWRAMTEDVAGVLCEVAQTDTSLDVRRNAAFALPSTAPWVSKKIAALMEVFSKLAVGNTWRESIVEHLGETNSEALPHLERIAVTDPTPAVRQAAMRSIQRLKSASEAGPPAED